MRFGRMADVVADYHAAVFASWLRHVGYDGRVQFMSR